MLSALIDNLTEYRLLGWKLCSLRILRTLLHCLLASSVAVEKSNAILFLETLCMICFSHQPLEIFRIISLSLAFCNSTDIPWCGSFYHLSCWLLSGICILQFWDMFLYFGFDPFLPAVSSILFLELLLLDVGVPQLILQFSHLFSSVVYSFILLFCLLGYFVSFYFLILPTEIFILTLAIFNFPGFFSSLLTSVPSKFLCFLFVCLLAFLVTLRGSNSFVLSDHL